MILDNKKGNKGSLVTDSIWLTIVKIVTIFISLMITKILSVKLSLAEYGTYSQANLIISTTTAISIVGLSDGVNYFYNGFSENDKKKTYINTIFGIQLFIGLFCAAVIFGFKDLLTIYFNNDALKPIYIWIIFSPMLANFIAMYQVLFISIGEAKIIAIRNLIVSIIKLGIIVLATLITKNVLTIFILLFVTDILQVFYFAYFFGRRNFFINVLKFDKKIVKQIMKYCLPLAVYILTNSLSRDMDRYIVANFASTDEYAIFSNCAKMLPFDILTTSFATVMIPIVTKYISKKMYIEAQNLYKNYLKFAYITTWIIAFGAIICAKEFILLLYDEKYLPGIPIFIIYVFVDMIRFANVAIILRAKGKTKLLMFYSIGMLGANFILNILFYHFWGLYGPALSTFLVTLVMNVLMLIEGTRIIHCKLNDIFDLKEMKNFLIQLIFIGFIMLIIKIALNKYFLNVSYFVELLIVYGMYLLIMILLNYKKILLVIKNMNKIKG